MLERLAFIEDRYNEINNMLMDPQVLSDISKSKELSKELASIEDIVLSYRKYKSILQEIDDTKEMLSDKELEHIAK